MPEAVKVIGAGLAGCEAAYQLASRGVPVHLYEMKPEKKSPAHSYEGFAELVCSNSLRSDRLANGAGLLKEETLIKASLRVSAQIIFFSSKPPSMAPLYMASLFNLFTITSISADLAERYPSFLHSSH